MLATVWQKCFDLLQEEEPAQFNTWIRPLQAQEQGDTLVLLAPNRFVLDWVRDNYLQRITDVLSRLVSGDTPTIKLEVGTTQAPVALQPSIATVAPPASQENGKKQTHFGYAPTEKPQQEIKHNLRRDFTFTNYIEGHSNQLALAAAMQVAENPGGAYNPLYIYGGVGLGKTHLMQAIGNAILQRKPDARILYLHSERYVADMVKGLQNNAIDDFKRFYRAIDVLMIDDIQFFAGKGRSQEEFFHTFNALLEGEHQIVLSCDRYPKEIEGLEERLKSRFGWGLTVAIEPPELETRVAILAAKAKEYYQVELSNEVAFFVAKRIRSNVRELEGAMRRVMAQAQFTGKPITVEFTRDALKDLIALQDKLVTIENIQKTVASYYKIKVADLLSKRRTRSITLPRQIAMTLAKELTNHSLPEIGDAFGGRDHTTVIHAVRKITGVLKENAQLAEDYKNLLRTIET